MFLICSFFFFDRRASFLSLPLSLSLSLSPPHPLDPLPLFLKTPLQLTLVGKILDASEHASSTVLRVDDGTGIVSVKYWGDNDDEAGEGDGAAARRARRPHALQSSTPPMRRHIGVFSEAHLEQTRLLWSLLLSGSRAGGGAGAAAAAPPPPPPPEEVVVVVEAEVEGDELRR